MIYGNEEALLIAAGIIIGISLCMGAALAFLLWAGSRWKQNQDTYLKHKQ